MKTILGIDEAGRGPVIGSMFIAGVLIEKKDEKKLKEIGVKDSKLLKNDQRELMFDKIIGISKGTRIIKVGPKEIDNALSPSSGINLNWLEAEKSAELINEFKPDKVILDSPHVIPKKYEEYVRNLLRVKQVDIVSEHKADINYPVVSAASILAKVAREREIEELKNKYGEIGPGYPSNQITQKFIKENFERHPEIFRKSWKTFQNLVKNKSQRKIKEYT